MERVLRAVVHVALAMWIGWNTYRHVAVYLFRGRVVVVTERVLGILTIGVFWIASFILPVPVGIPALLLALVVAVVLARAEIWLVAGASRGRILERAGLVLRGMGFSFDGSDGRSVEESGGRIRLSVVASAGPRTHVLRLRTTRGIKKVALFKVNFRKFLVALPRERR